MAKKPKLALIDAHALIHRAYHALPPMSDSAGRPLNAVYGFTTMLLKMLTTLKPTHVVAAFDVKGPTFRHKEFADYKAHRKPADDDLVVQFDVVREVLRAFNVPVIDKQGFEADDILGTLTARVNGEVKKIIVTGDMDALQLVDEATSVFTLKRGMTDTILYTPTEVQEKYGFAPEFVPDYKGLAGDASDNIPGVAGIGDKTARDLVGQYGSINNIFDHLDELSTRAQKHLKGHKKEAQQSKRLATIKRDVAIKFNLADAQMADFDASEVRKIFERLEFHSLLNKIPKSARGEAQPTLFSAEASGETKKLPEHYHLIEGEAAQKKLRDKLSKFKLIAFDTETDGLGARTSPMVGMSLAVREHGEIEAWYVPVTPESVRTWKSFLEDPKIGKVGHNLKYDIQVLAQSGIKLGPIVFDSMVGSYLLRPSARQHGMDALAMQELGHQTISITSLIGPPRRASSGKEQKKMSEVPLAQLTPYACEDAEIALRLYEKLFEQVKEAGMQKVLTELDLPLVAVLARMELVGVKLDKAVLKGLQKKVARRIESLRKKIWALAGEEFNVNSTQQLRVVLYEKLKLPTEGINRTQSGFSTAASELKKLRAEHDIISLLEEYRELSKLQNTYIETLPELVGADGRLHGSFNQTVAATGRLSSADPNLQNIPVRTQLGQEIRTAFVAERGKRLVKADYSQLELRIAAHLSGDKKMTEAFLAGEDIHRATAAWVNGVTLDEVTEAQRRGAKTLNFGVLYGMGAQNFARTSGISVEEARSFIARYWEQYAGLAELRDRLVRQAEETGFVETLQGRRLPVMEISARAPSIRAQAERAAFNWPIQGTEADILKMAMISLDKRLRDDFDETEMILTVHDELVCEVPAGQVNEVAKLMKEVMEGVVKLDVPLVVEASAGMNWRDTKSV